MPRRLRPPRRFPARGFNPPFVGFGPNLSLEWNVLVVLNEVFPLGNYVRRSAAVAATVLAGIWYSGPTLSTSLRGLTVTAERSDDVVTAFSEWGLPVSDDQPSAETLAWVSQPPWPRRWRDGP